MSSEYIIKKDSKTLIISFGGKSLKFGGILPFEFLNFLNTYFENIDKIFYIDKSQINYHKGISSISSNIDETVLYLREKIKDYDNVIFCGTSSGGYASILFGSLLNVNKVIAFIPQTILKNKNNMSKYDEKYIDIKKYINNSTKYYIFGDTNVKDINDSHHISHCSHIEEFPNVIIFKKNRLSLVEMKNSGELYSIFDKFINE